MRSRATAAPSSASPSRTRFPIPFDCQDGECGSCLVEVKHLDPTRKYAIALTEKEKEGLRQLGKITKTGDRGRRGQRHAAALSAGLPVFRP